jgi:MFS family permease
LTTDDPQERLQQSEVIDAGLPPSEGWQKVFSALRIRNYRWFYVGQTISLIGTWTRTAALGWVAYQFTHSEFLLGMVFVLNSLPLFIFAVYAGSLADRIPKMRIFTWSTWFSMLSSALIAIMLFFGPVHIGYLMAFSALWGVSTAFEMPARQSLMIELVGKNDLVNAIALNSAMVNATRVVGPAIGGLLLASVGAAWCFLLDAVSYLAVLYSIFQMKLPAAHYETRNVGTGMKHMLEGFRYLKSNVIMAQAMVLLFIMGLGGWAYQSQLSAFAVTQLHMRELGYSALLATNGFGACTAALYVASQGSRLVKLSTMYVGATLYGTFIILCGFAHQTAMALPLIFVAGFGIILFFSIGNSIIQTQSPDHLRGRLMGIWALVFGGGMPIGSFWMGVTASKTGSGHALQLGGMFCLIGAFVVWVVSYSRRRCC